MKMKGTARCTVQGGSDPFWVYHTWSFCEPMTIKSHSDNFAVVPRLSLSYFHEVHAKYSEILLIVIAIQRFKYKG